MTLVAHLAELRRRSEGDFDLPEGTIYPALHRLEQAGLLSSNWTTPPNGRRRRVYALTKSGVSRLADGRKAWSRFAKAVDVLALINRTLVSQPADRRAMPRVAACSRHTSQRGPDMA